MGRSRRRCKPLVVLPPSQPCTTAVTTDVCKNCRLVQKDYHHNDYQSRNSRKQQSVTKDLKQKTSQVIKYISDCESEADSAIDTASISSSSDNSSLSFSDLGSSIIGVEDCRHSLPKSKSAEVSVAELEKQEAHTDLLALTEYVTGVPFQKFTTKDSCVECIESYKRALHIHQHNHMRMCGVDDEFFMDLSGLDVQLHVEEFTTWSFGSTTIQTKEHGYYVSPQGATYYTDIPIQEARLLSLPRQLMIPPSERAMFTATHPPQRPWIPITHPTRDASAVIFTVMGYNVLCESYCNRQTYGYTPSWALHWDYRRRGILEEIRHYAADIICLQEVEKEQFETFFKPEFEKDGYDGIFDMKARSKTLDMEGLKRLDGCAIFWRVSKFRILGRKSVMYSEVAIKQSKNNHSMINRVHNKDNIGQFALLETLEDAWDPNALPVKANINRPVLVANTHITWDPDFCEVKLIQAMMMTNDMKDFLLEKLPDATRSDDPTRPNVPVVMAGDFNSERASEVVKFITEGKVSKTTEDIQKHNYSNTLDQFSHSPASDSNYKHAFNLKSAYSEKHMKYTNFTYEFKGILDYIFHSEHLNTLGVLGQLEESWFTENKVVGCPHAHIPSDHFSLLVEYELPDKEVR